MRIIGPPSAAKSTVVNSLMGMNSDPRFLGEMFEPLWNASLRYSLDPVGVVAQSWKETSGGRFSGRVQPFFMNPCGLKVRDKEAVKKLLGTTDDDHPLVHQQFCSWEVGALAQVHHLRAYSGWPVEPPVLSPRYVWVIGRYACENFEDLSGKWAPSPTYGPEIVTIARKLQVTA